MEIFNFVERSFDINLINKCKSRLGSKTIKKINLYLLGSCQSDIPLNNFKVTIISEKNRKKIHYISEENKNNKIIFENYEKKTITSGEKDA